MTTTTQATQPTSKIEELVARRDALLDRLDTGAVKIEEGRAQGKDVSSWEDFWLILLRAYEQVCDQLRAMAPPQQDEKQ